MIALVAIGLGALLVNAPSGMAASITLSFNGTVTGFEPALAGSGIAIGDQVDGVIHFDPANFDITYYAPGPFSNFVDFVQDTGLMYFSLTRPGGSTYFSIIDPITMADVGSGTLFGTDSVSINSLGANAGLTLNLGTSDTPTILSTLNGLPTTADGILALLGGPISNATGEGSFGGGKFAFSLNIPVIPVATTPIPATLPLLVSALGGLGFLGWRRKRS